MTVWEYMVKHGDGSEQFPDVLDKWGDQGWELVTLMWIQQINDPTDGHKGPGWLYVFKRPKEIPSA